MFDNGLLVLTSSAVRLASAATVLRKCCEFVRKVLYVHLVNTPEISQFPTSLKPVSCTKSVLKFINEFYICSNEFKVFDVNFIITNISNNVQWKASKCPLGKGYQVVLTDVNEGSHVVLKSYLQKCFPRSNIGNESLTVIQLSGIASDCTINGGPDPMLPSYTNVCLGGTFDRLHTGHKILLNQAAIITDEKLIVGVTNGNMNKKKILHELMESTEERISEVTTFLEDIKPNLTYDIVPIDDPFGPSIHDPNINCIVVSEETIKGATLINEQRKVKKFPSLEVEAIDLVYDSNADSDDEKKISSSSIRKNLLGKLFRKPRARNLPDHPYLIGLTGSIASGKTSVGKRLEGLGAGVINCDLLGHQAYEPGTKAFKKIVGAFGSEVVHGDGTIDRKVLGGIVFKDKEKLSLLNSIVWPAIVELIPQHVENLVQQGKNVVVLDAAVLLEAGWEQYVHEVWTSIIPTDEAEQRIMDRNKMSREQARERIRSQMTNEERVKRSHVILCTLWEYEVTQKQVEKAWKFLMERMPK